MKATKVVQQSAASRTSAPRESRKVSATPHQRYLAAIVESADDAIFGKTLDGRILSWNAGAERMYGYRPEEIVGDWVFRLAPPERHSEIDDILSRIRRGERISHHETVRVRRNGEAFPVSLAISPVRDDTGVITGASTVARDITEQRRLAESLRAVIETIDDGALVCGPDGAILQRNPAAARLVPDITTEAELKAALGLAEPDNADEAGAFDGEADDAGREYALSVDGATRWLRVTRRPVAVTPSVVAGAPVAAQGSILLLRDITELRAIQASREGFIGVLSHELRTPITSIFAAAKMLHRFEAGARRDELLSDIAAESDRLYRLVEDLLVLTRIERERLSIAGEPVLMGPIIQRVVAAERARMPDAVVEMEVASGLPIVCGEDTYVEQIVRNLVGNALKYGPRDGVVRVVAEPADDGVIVRVLDEGPGIAADEMDRVFDLLYRSPATAAQASGSGIGLFVSRRLAEAMNGRVWARPRTGRGAEFGFQLPSYERVLDVARE